MHTITLLRGPDARHARTTAPHVRALFGTDTLPCAFLPTASVSAVLAAIRRLDPHATVAVSGERLQHLPL